jgi:site-specific DNA-methyltransferase (adenine-specific)
MKQDNQQQDAKTLALPLGRILAGDCLEVMAGLPSKSIKIVVTSPPYNIKNSSGNGLKDGRGGKWPGAALQDGYATHDDCMDHAAYVAWQRACLAEMLRLLRPDGAIFYNHKWRVQNGLLQDRADIMDGFPLRQIIIWHRSGGINFNPGYFLPNYEVIYLIAGPRFRLAPKANAQGCIWKIHQETGNPHPAPFPVELAERCIRSVGAGPVLDPFMGSGSTALAARRAGVDWLGIEKSPEYIKLAEERIASSEAEL